MTVGWLGMSLALTQNGLPVLWSTSSNGLCRFFRPCTVAARASICAWIAGGIAVVSFSDPCRVFSPILDDRRVLLRVQVVARPLPWPPAIAGFGVLPWAIA